jgi:hypothetical protein
MAEARNCRRLATPLANGLGVLRAPGHWRENFTLHSDFAPAGLHARKERNSVSRSPAYTLPEAAGAPTGGTAPLLIKPHISPRSAVHNIREPVHALAWPCCSPAARWCGHAGGSRSRS